MPASRNTPPNTDWRDDVRRKVAEWPDPTPEQLALIVRAFGGAR